MNKNKTRQESFKLNLPLLSIFLLLTGGIIIYYYRQPSRVERALNNCELRIDTLAKRYQRRSNEQKLEIAKSFLEDICIMNNNSPESKKFRSYLVYMDFWQLEDQAEQLIYLDLIVQMLTTNDEIFKHTYSLVLCLVEFVFKWGSVDDCLLVLEVFYREFVDRPDQILRLTSSVEYFNPDLNFWPGREKLLSGDSLTSEEIPLHQSTNEIGQRGRLLTRVSAYILAQHYSVAQLKILLIHVRVNRAIIMAKEDSESEDDVKFLMSIDPFRHYFPGFEFITQREDFLQEAIILKEAEARKVEMIIEKNCGVLLYWDNWEQCL